jgi:organic radical activating enzyme
MAKSRLEGGFIIPPTHFELVVADQCNISCRCCNHASPVVARWFADPHVVHRDFSVLAKYYHPRIVKVLGGEPLLNRELAEVIRAARKTGISEHFRLTTNGALLHKMEDAVMEVIDELEISVYPGVPRMSDILALARQKTLRFDKQLTVNEYDAFRATFTSVGTDDVDLVQKVYDACKIANVWGCHAVRDGYFYKCPQSIYIPQLVENIPGVDADRIRITDSEDFQAQLLAFVNSPNLLMCCTYCVGTVGRLQPHTLVPRGQWRINTQKPSEELIDYDWLERSLIKQDSFDDCKIPTVVDPAQDPRRSSWWRRVVRMVSRPASRAFAPHRQRGPVRQTAAETRRESTGAHHGEAD